MIPKDETTTCDREGIAGDCGFACPVFQAGECEYRDEVIEERRWQEADDRYHAMKDDGRLG